MSNTPYLGLKLPDRSSTGWADDMNGNLSAIDAETSSIRTALTTTLAAAKAYTDAAVTGVVAGQLENIDAGTF